jgi:hypothetical protein
MTLNSQFKPRTPSDFAAQNPSKFPSPSTAPLPRFPSREPSQSVFSSKERESLDEHFAGLDPGSLVLTPKQSLALKEENRINQQRISSFNNPAQQPQADFLNKERTVGRAFNHERGRQGNRFQNIENQQNNKLFTLNEPFKRQAIRFLDEDIPENRFPEPVLPDMVLDGSKVPSQPSQIQPLTREQQFINWRQKQKTEDPKSAAKTISQSFVVEEQVRHQQQVPLRKHFQKEQESDQERNQGSHPSLFLNQPDLQQLFWTSFSP